MGQNNAEHAVVEAGGNVLSISVQNSFCALCASEFVLQCDAQRHGADVEHEHALIEVGIVFEPGKGILSRSGSFGREELALVGPCLYVVPAGARHTVHWELPSEVFIAHAEKGYWSKAAGLADVVFGPILAARNSLVFWESATLLRHIWNEVPLLREQAVPVADWMLGCAARLSSLPHVAEKTSTGGLAPSKRHAMDEYIDRQLRFNLHSADLAKFVGSSVTQLTLHLKRDTDMTPHEYITYRRMLRAQQLLGTGDYCVAEVASAVGFDDPDYFSRIFRRFFNFTPRELIFRSRKAGGKMSGKTAKTPRVVF